jgi:hypothetical protein
VKPEFTGGIKAGTSLGSFGILAPIVTGDPAERVNLSISASSEISRLAISPDGSRSYGWQKRNWR